MVVGWRGELNPRRFAHGCERRTRMEHWQFCGSSVCASRIRVRSPDKSAQNKNPESDSSTAGTGSGIDSGFAFRARRRPAVGASASAVALASNGSVSGDPSAFAPTSSSIRCSACSNVALHVLSNVTPRSKRASDSSSPTLPFSRSETIRCNSARAASKVGVSVAGVAGIGVVHSIAGDSTRLMSSPWARIVVIRSPFASWFGAVTISPDSVRRVIE